MKSGPRPSVCRLQSALCQHARLAALLTSPVRSRRYLHPTRSTLPLHISSGGVSQVKLIQEEVDMVQAWFQNVKQRPGDHLCVTMPTPPEPSSCQSEQQRFVLCQQNNRQTRQEDDVLRSIKPSSVIQSAPSHTGTPEHQKANTATHPEDNCGHFCGTHTDTGSPH